MKLEMLFTTEKNKREKRKKTRKIRRNKEKDKEKNKKKDNKKEKQTNESEEIPDFKNETLLKSLKTNKYFYVVLIVTLLLSCKSKKKPFLFSLGSFVLMTFLGYLAHMISHQVNMNQILIADWSRTTTA